MIDSFAMSDSSGSIPRLRKLRSGVYSHAEGPNEFKITLPEQTQAVDVAASAGSWVLSTRAIAKHFQPRPIRAWR